jgi:monoterpene epsilon-lactone hydrolase
MMSKRARIVRAVTGIAFKLTDAKATNTLKIRRKLHVFANLLPTAFGVQVTPDHIGDFKVEWLAPKQAPDGKLILYLHGGAFIMGGCQMHRQFVSHIARASGFRAVVPEYRLAPEHPFPAAIDDVVSIYRSLISTGLMPGDIILAGDSAGANLAIALMLKLRDAGEPLPAAACLLSPWIDLSLSGESMKTNADKDPWFREDDIRHIASLYCDENQIMNPLASPVYADASGLPPLYIQVGGDEVLLSDSLRLADNVRSSGGEAEIEIWPQMWHVFQVFVGVMPESHKAIDKIGAYIQRVFAAAD